MNRCSQKGCPFPALDGEELCRYHLALFELDESLLDSEERLTLPDVLSREEGLSIIRRGDYARDIYAASGRCNRCGAGREAGRKFCSQCLAYDRFRKRRKVAKGLCRTCGRSAEPSRTRCRTCLQKQLLRTLARTRLKIKFGLCSRCGRKNDRGKYLCNACESRVKLYRRRRSAEALRLRLCRSCRAQIEPGNPTTRCRRCRNADNRRHRIAHDERQRRVSPPDGGEVREKT